MQTLTIAALLLCGANEWESGSLVVFEDSNKVVAVWTDSDVTHLAMLMTVGGEPCIYEATPARVRCVPLARYCHELTLANGRRRDPVRMWILEPKEPYQHDQLAQMHAYLNRQLGRRYSVKGYVRKRPAEGIHCAELASTALARGGCSDFSGPQTMSPGVVFERAKPLHRPPVEVDISARRGDASWCANSWERWFAFQSWCGWACYESFTFCW